MRQTSTLSHPTHDGLVRESVQVAACPCWEEVLPDVISSICVEVLGPVPRRASAVRLPVSSRRTSASPYVQEVRRVVISNGKNDIPAVANPSNSPRGLSLDGEQRLVSVVIRLSIDGHYGFFI